MTKCYLIKGSDKNLIPLFLIRTRIILNRGYILKKKILLFFLGIICFIVAQPLLRINILNNLQNSTKFIAFYTVNPLLVGILIAFSAGIFEESFRFIFRKFL